MSFRSRLTLFFLLIVVLPMIAVAVFVLEVSGDSETGKADARLAAGLDSAISIYESELRDAQGPLREVATDPEVSRATATGDTERATGLAERLRRQQGLEYLALVSPDGEELASVGQEPPFAAAEVVIRDGDRIGSVVGSLSTPTSYVSEVRDLTGRETLVTVNRESATTLPVGELEPPAPDTAETVEFGGSEQRAASARLGGGYGPDPVVTVFGPIEEGGLAGGRPIVAAVLAVFFLVALAFVALLLRALHRQTGSMLEAAKRVGAGDFSGEVPVEGDDEMAGLAQEFNKMSGRLSSQMDELRGQRVELADSVRRIGNAFASGLDRAAVLEIVAETALSACSARSARVQLDGLERPIEVGRPPSKEGMTALQSAESAAIRSRSLASVGEAQAFAVAHPLAPAGTPESGPGAIAILREDGSDFSSEAEDVLRYLVAQASTSIENISLHEQVSEQAVTDELTSLANSRALRGWLDNEVERVQRFGHKLSLLVIDLDDFKLVNDVHGHLQGDEVLRSIGPVIRRELRGIDEPARYGGEEFAVGLPETDTPGAVEVAERIRARIEEMEIERSGGSGTLRVTASIGVATLPQSADDAKSLFAAADEALYRAKAAGKNRVVASAVASTPPAQGDTEIPRK